MAATSILFDVDRHRFPVPREQAVRLARQLLADTRRDEHSLAAAAEIERALHDSLAPVVEVTPPLAAALLGILDGCDLSHRDQLGLARLVDLLSHRQQPQP